MTKIATSLIHVWAEIDDQLVDVFKFEASFPLNGIPTAELGVAVGRETGSLRASTAHRIVNDIRQTLKVKVWMEADQPGDEDSERWPDGKFLIFEGDTGMVGWDRDRNAAALTIPVNHWLNRLAFSSAMSATSHPANPADLAFNATTTAMRGQAAGGTFGTPITANQGIFATSGGADFWGSGILPWLIEISRLETIDLKRLAGFVATPSDNTIVTETLERMRGSGSCTAKLRIDAGDIDAAELIRSMALAINVQSFQNFLNVTLWDKLVAEFAPTFQFALVPRIADALVVPFVPGLRTTWTKIEDSHYDPIRIFSETIRPLRALAVFGSVAASAGGFTNGVGTQATPNVGVGGWFDSGQTNGMIDYKSAPSWIINTVRPSAYAPGSSGADGGVKSSAVFPGRGKANTKPDPVAIMNSAKTVLDRYAQTLYVAQTLRNSTGTLSGKLRFDISPGSTVSFETAGDPFIRNDGFQGLSYASVLGVTIAINSEAGGKGAAGTSFMLGHIRSEKENESDAFSVDRHPIWGDIFKGCTLSSDFKV